MKNNKIPYSNSPHKFRMPQCYKDNPELLEARAKKEDVKHNKEEAKFFEWYNKQLKLNGYKVSNNLKSNTTNKKMLNKQPYKKYILDTNNPPIHGLRVSFPTKSGIRKVREEAYHRGIRNIKSTYYGHYVSVLPPELVTQENVNWLNSKEAIRENLPIPISDLYKPVEKKESEPVKIDAKKWASWAKKL